jgi:hypothetical protein
MLIVHRVVIRSEAASPEAKTRRRNLNFLILVMQLNFLKLLE